MSRAPLEPGISLEECVQWMQAAVVLDPLDPQYQKRGRVMLPAILATLQRLRRAQAIAREQAEDEGLWFRAEYASEAYLQQALRKIHAEIEGGAATTSTAFAEI